MSTERVMGCIDKAIGIIGKILLSIVLGAITLIMFSLIVGFWISLICDYFFPEKNGSYDLGDGIYMIDWDYNRLIVEGTSFTGKACYGGKYIMPDSIVESVRVIDARADSAWIIVKSIPRPDTGSLLSIDGISDRRFLIINKQSYFESRKDSLNDTEYVYVYADSALFINACMAKGISLRFNE